MNMQASASTALYYSSRINFNGVHTDKALNLEHYNFIESPWLNAPTHEYATRSALATHYYQYYCYYFLY